MVGALCLALAGVGGGDGAGSTEGQAGGSLDEHGPGAAATSACWPQGSAFFLPSSCLSLPQHILYCIVDSECKSRDVLQSYFDLLGELMKFNVDAFKRFNKYINTDAKVRLARALWGLPQCSEVVVEG